MADNTNKVTIDAAFFCELFRKANETDDICKSCREEHTAEEFNALVKERDELKHQLELKDEQCRGCAALCVSQLQCEELTRDRDALRAKLDCAEVDREAFLKRAETAERCIEDVYDVLKESVITDCGDGLQVYEIIRAYREAKEAK